VLRIGKTAIAILTGRDGGYAKAKLLKLGETDHASGLARIRALKDILAQVLVFHDAGQAALDLGGVDDDFFTRPLRGFVRYILE